ncbi:tRNA methyltransferase, has a role in tRNA modification [Actinomortierella ambigua]|nr:tRNA methyltransferase, has a role in tRNA modification [Actinomortierella ambigua]
MSKAKNPLHVPSPFQADNVALTEAQQEEEHVHSVYQAIAPHFSATRYKPWPVVEEFLMTMPPGYLGADVGCGNGKYIGVNPRLFLLGSDRSSNLISICAERGHEALVSDGLSLGYRSGMFDFAISIAVIHHFVSPERRLAAIEEILRIVRPGGRILIFVWALEQSGKRDFDKNVQDVFVPWALPARPTPKKEKQPRGRGKKAKGTNETTQEAKEQESSSTAASFTADQTMGSPTAPPSTIGENTDPSVQSAAPVFKRYYHLFRQGELEELVMSSGKVKIDKQGYDRDNWWCIAEKISP